MSAAAVLDAPFASPGMTDALAAVPRVRLGDLPIAVLSMDETADLMIRLAALPRDGRRRPLHLTSANGEVISRCRREAEVARLFAEADLINADGQPMVIASRLLTRTPLPERVATTDLFHHVARRAVAAGRTFYMLGADEGENARAVERALALHPGLRIVGHSHGYLSGAALEAKLAEIDALAPDILWLALGVPREQAFVREHGHKLAYVGLIKTSGGLFNFLSGTRRRAPDVLQRLGLEWAWRLAQEPRRLFWRYAVTNPHALYLLATRSG